VHRNFPWPRLPVAAVAPAPKLIGTAQRKLGLLKAPVLYLQTPADADHPALDADYPADVTVGDKVTVQYGTNADFSGATSVSHTLTVWSASYNIVDLNQAGLTNGNTYYFRYRVEYADGQGSWVPGPWSNAVSYTVATITIPITPTAQTCTADVTRFSDPASGPTLPMSIQTNVDFGTPDAGRNIIVGVGGSFNAAATLQNCYVNTDKQMAAGDLVGTSLTKVVSTEVSGSLIGMYCGVVAAGRTGRVLNELTIATRVGVHTQRAYGLTSSTPTATGTQGQTTNPGTFNINGTFTMPANGFALALMYAQGSSALAHTWQNSFVEQGIIDVRGISFDFLAIAKRTASGSGIQAAIIYAAGSGGIAVYAAWG
jgi:hypothetical protein